MPKKPETMEEAVTLKQLVTLKRRFDELDSRLSRVEEAITGMIQGEDGDSRARASVKGTSEIIAGLSLELDAALGLTPGTIGRRVQERVIECAVTASAPV